MKSSHKWANRQGEPLKEALMFNPTTVVAAAFGDYLAELYLQYFSDRKTVSTPVGNWPTWPIEN